MLMWKCSDCGLTNYFKKMPCLCGASEPSVIRTISYLEAMRLQNKEHHRIGIPTLNEVMEAKQGRRTNRGEVVKVLNASGQEPLGSPYRIICL